MRRWPRVSMRIAMIAVALACVIAAWAGYEYRRLANFPRRVVGTGLLTTSGVRTYVNFARDDDGKTIRMIFIPCNREQFPLRSGHGIHSGDPTMEFEFTADKLFSRGVELKMPRDSRFAVLTEEHTLRPLYLTLEEWQEIDRCENGAGIVSTDVFKRKIEPVLEEEAWGTP